MKAFAHVRVNEQKLVALGPGDTIGRTARATLRINDPRISEAHALVSLRRGRLVLLALRGGFSKGRQAVMRAPLDAGMSLTLAPGLALHVEEVSLPRTALGVALDTGAPRLLPGTASVMGAPEFDPVDRCDPAGLLNIWWDGEDWYARPRGEAVRRVSADDQVELRVGQTLRSVRFVAIPIEATTSTADQHADQAPALRILVWYESVELHREGAAPCVIGGIGARLLSELLLLRGPVAWNVVAKEVWPGAGSSRSLRQRWDVTLSRLRTRLRRGGVRANLIQHDGAGRVQCLLYPNDKIEDHT